MASNKRTIDKIFVELFDSPDGQKVLAYILDKAGLFKPVGREATAYDHGVSDLAKWIFKKAYRKIDLRSFNDITDQINSIQKDMIVNTIQR